MRDARDTRALHRPAGALWSVSEGAEVSDGSQLLPEDDRMATRHALLRAGQAPDYDEAKRAWIPLHGAVKKANLTAGRYLKVGLEETLKLQRAGV